MFMPGPIDFALAALFSLRRFGPLRTLLGGIAVAIGIQPFLPPVPCSCFGPMLRRCAPRVGAYRAAVRSDLKNLASQQEIHYSDAYAYSSDLREIGFWWSDGVTVSIVAKERGWAAFATHAAMEEGEGCAIRYGETIVAEMGGLHLGEPGEITCTW